MKAVIQRVTQASVTVEGKKISEVQNGIVTLLGIEKGDTEEQLKKLIDKILDLRIFSDDQGKMNQSLIDKRYAHLIVSQFTLAGDCTQGRRPSFVQAESPERAKELYEKAIRLSTERGIETQGGVFQTDMKVNLINDGPVTFILENKPLNHANKDSSDHKR